MIEYSRLKWVDFVRAAAICFVVLCHATESIYRLALDDIMALSIQSRIFCFVSFTCGRIGVPLFLMISGSLLLTRYYDEQKIKQFWRKKWLHLLICTLIWFAVYDCFILSYRHEPISLLQFINEMFFLSKVKMSHVWYLPSILGIYILLPFVASVLREYNNLVIFPLIFFTVYSFGFSTFNIFYRCYFPQNPLANQFSTGFSGGIYGLLIIYGYFIRKGAFSKLKTIYITLISLASFIMVVYMQIWSYQKGSVYNVWYDNLFLLSASMGFFELARRMGRIYGYKVIKEISKYSFSIYLTHNIVREVLRTLIIKTSLNKPCQVFLLWLVCFSCSFLISWLISKIPRVGKYILYM